MKRHQNCKETPQKQRAVRTSPRTTAQKRSPTKTSPTPKVNSNTKFSRPAKKICINSKTQLSRPAKDVFINSNTKVSQPTKDDFINTKVSRPTKDIFIKLHNLMPKKRAERITTSHRKRMEKIDIDEPISLSVPTKTCLHKSLMSQLSRNTCVRTSSKIVSFSEPVDNGDEENAGCRQNDDTEDKPLRSRKSLLTIDISSLLGQRIQNHFQINETISVITNAEEFCKTSVKNYVMRMVRNSTVIFPTTYKPRRRSDVKNVHQYQFTKKQKKDFMKKVRTGLNKYSQSIAESIPKCQVLLKHLTDRQLKKWLSNFTYRNWKGIKSAKPVGKSIFPKEQLLKSRDVNKLLGLIKAKQSSSAVNETFKQKFTLYRYLLSNISDEFNGSVKSKNMSKKTSAVVKSSHLSPRPYGYYGLNRLKISNTKSDDDISMVSVSSDEESSNSSCCTGCQTRKYCRLTPDQLLSHNFTTQTETSTSKMSTTKFVSSLNAKQKMGKKTCATVHSGQLNAVPCKSYGLNGPIISNTKSEDDYSVLSISSDEEPCDPSCCTGCRTRNYWKCAQKLASPTEALSSKMSDKNLVGSLSKTCSLPLDVPLKIEPYNSPIIKSPDISPHSCISLHSTTSSSSYLSSRNSLKSVKTEVVSDQMHACAVQRQSPRILRSVSVGNVFNLKTSKSSNVLVRNSSSFASKCLRSGHVVNVKVSRNNSQKKGRNVRARRSTRLLSSPVSSPGRLRTIEMTYK